jgi:hypothetical protein
MYKILPTNERADIEDTRTYRSPFPELSQNLYEVFYNFMFGFCEGFASTAPKEDFIMKVESNHIIFGWLNNEFIENYIESSEEFDSTWLQMKLDPPKLPVC